MILLSSVLHLYSVDLDTLDSLTDVEHPLKPGGPTEVFGSCNGLIGLSNSETDLAIYNPSTQRIHRLPVQPVDLPEGCRFRGSGYVFYGFGYDSVNDDYKVLRMVQFKTDPDEELGCISPYEVKVYSLKTDLWRTIKTVSFFRQYLFYFCYHLLFRRGYGVLVGNSLHWVLPRMPGMVTRNIIFGFDLGSEVFRNVPVSELHSDGSEEVMMDLGALDGCLCLTCNYHQVYVDVWVMKEYGVKESWTKLFTVQRQRTVNSFAYLKPLVYSKDGEKVLLEVNNRKFQWFDLNSKKLSTVRIKDCPSSFSSEVVMSSLVLNGGSYKADNHRQQQGQLQEENKSRKKRDKFLSEGFRLVL